MKCFSRKIELFSFWETEFLISLVESTRIRRTKNLNLKQSVNQSRPEVIPMLTGFVMLIAWAKSRSARGPSRQPAFPISRTRLFALST